MMEAILLLATIAGRFQVHAVAEIRSNPCQASLCVQSMAFGVALKERPGELAARLRKATQRSQHRRYGNDHRD